MINGMVGFYAVVAVAEEKERKAFEAHCAKLPKEEADKLRAERKAEQKASRELNSQRRHELAVAREGRSLNFWGNR